MVQAWNWPAIALTARILSYKQNLLVPHATAISLEKVNFTVLKQNQIKGVLLDKDNTITKPYKNTLQPRLRQSIEKATSLFGNRNVVIISNSAGGPDDDSFKEATAVENSIGLPVLRRTHKKPAGIESVLAHFDVSDPSQLVMIGDRLLTDVAFGNKHGMLTIHTHPLTTSGDPLIVRCARRFENVLVSVFRYFGVRAPAHKLASTDCAVDE